MSGNEKTTATVNQIRNSKPSAPRSENVLTGYIATSMNGGMVKPIGYKKVMAGEKIRNLSLQLHIKMLTPKTPNYQGLKMCVKCYFVPNSRVWDNAEAYTAQKGGSTVTKISEIPNTGGKTIPWVADSNTKFTLLSNTTIWRDSYISTYIPRYSLNTKTDSIGSETISNTLPKISILKLRGFKAIWNDYERNKEYDTPMNEYKTDIVSRAEWDSYLPNPANNNYWNTIIRAKRQNDYYTDYRTEMQGFELDKPTETENELLNWATWEHKIAEARSQAENAQMNDWDIIAKIRGSKPLTEGKVQLIGKKTFNLNYAAVTQSTYNSNQNIDETFQVMGQQGAYSYTEIKFDLINFREFKEEGYLHYIAIVYADNVFETGIDRNELNVTPFSEYRPDLKDVKNDVLYEIEYGTMSINSSSQEEIWNTAMGFKRKYNEYFKLPNVISGDMTTLDLYEKDATSGKFDNPVITNSTYQFFEIDGKYFMKDAVLIRKNIWKDYTDLLINKNQAIKNEIEFINESGGKNGIRVKGQNQLTIEGKAIAICDMPIDSAIKDNFTKWGEH